MSNENTAAAEKTRLELDPKYILHIAGTLLGICLVVALLLGVVNSFTKPVIDAAQAEKTAAAMRQVLPADEYQPMETLPDGVLSLNAAVSGGKTVGYVVEVEPSGSQGKITMLVGVDAETKAVTGVSVTSQKETANIGTKVVNDQSVLDRFIGLSHAEGDIQVNGGTEGVNRFDGISGATVSSKGVTTGVNTALAAVESLG